MSLCGFCPLAFLGARKTLCGKPPLAPCTSFLSITEKNPSSHSSHEMDAVQGDHCPVLIINPEGFILAVCPLCCEEYREGRGVCLGAGGEAEFLPRNPAASSGLISCGFEHELAQSQPSPSRSHGESMWEGEALGWICRGIFHWALPLPSPVHDPAGNSSWRRWDLPKTESHCI